MGTPWGHRGAVRAGAVSSCVGVLVHFIISLEPDMPLMYSALAGTTVVPRVAQRG